jgi:tRNA dimethylallyltransferase
MTAENSPSILCVVGPTGTGKSEIALRLAERFAGEIVNCDSRQVYRDFPIITAQPGSRERARRPHWLYGFLDSRQRMDAGKFAEQAELAVADISGRQRLPILVGGTGLYLRALLFGLAPVPEIPDHIRERVLRDYDRLGPEAMHEELRRVDPETASRLHPRDRQRVSRALEVHRATGEPLSRWQQRHRAEKPRFNALKIGLWRDLQDLTPRLRERIERMLLGGALQEARKGWDLCPDANAPVWSAIGGCEILQYILGKIELEEAKEKWLRSTRSYAKRQLTWFKADPEVVWFSPEQEQGIADRVREWLRGSGHLADRAAG